MPELFFLYWWQFGKIWILLILPKSDQSTNFLKIMIFHAYGSILLTLLNEKIFDPNLAKFDQIWTKFWGQIFCPSTTKWDLPRCIDSPSMNFLSNLVQKLFHLVHLKNKGQFLHDLAAFKVVNWRKDAQTHEVWAQSISFHVFSSISKKRWGFQDKSTHSKSIVNLQN